MHPVADMAARCYQWGVRMPLPVTEEGSRLFESPAGFFLCSTFLLVAVGFRRAIH